MKSKIDTNRHMRELFDKMINEGFETEYVEKVIAALPNDAKLASQILSYRLKYTKVILHKATQVDTSMESGISLSNYTLTLPANNVETCLDGADLEIIHHVCHHENILDAAMQEIISCFRDRLSKI